MIDGDDDAGWWELGDVGSWDPRVGASEVINAGGRYVDL